QHADAEDLSQEVMVTVGRRIDTFDPDAGGSFRGWLLKITRDLVVNKLTRGPKDTGTGDSNVMQLIAEHPEAEQTDTLFRMEHWRLRLHEVAEAIRKEFSDSVWKSFWMTAVEQHPIAEVARELNKSEGAVRVARCRILARIRKTVDEDGCPYSL
ncbi:MAG TPA: sigma-70 family RNA polymerase sigma factor, partial [Planctomycetaceae bacterium]|nr:sigma-70 family RNA polymerase sigma factor [Planctomycetaceae bacterium]